jgi:hypothetical protein
MSAAIGLMHALGDASSMLARLPASDHAKGVNAGMTFTMLRSVEPLLPGRVERHVLVERVTALVQTRCAISSQARAALSEAARRLAELV